MREASTQDTRGFFVLPQGFEGGGYYVYGTPGNGRGQFAHPRMMTVIQTVACEWCQVDSRKFGVGNISLADGVRFQPHRSHRSGLEVDVRAIRRDGREAPCNRLDGQYDQGATAKLIGLFLQQPMVKAVRFNDISIPGVRSLAGHNDHFHVEVRF